MEFNPLHNAVSGGMSEKLPCRRCENLILPLTAERNDGMCVPCAKGYRDNIEAGKEYNARERELDKTDPSRLLWKKLHQTVYSEGAGLERLTPAQRIYWAVGLVVGATYRGGLRSYFDNSSADEYETAIHGLEIIGATESLNLLVAAKQILFGDKGVPKVQSERWLAVNKEADEQQLDRMDGLFYEDPDQIDVRMFTYAEREGLFDAA